MIQYGYEYLKFINKQSKTAHLYTWEPSKCSHVLKMIPVSCRRYYLRQSVARQTSPCLPLNDEQNSFSFSKDLTLDSDPEYYSDPENDDTNLKGTL